MSSTDISRKQEELEQLRDRVAQLEHELQTAPSAGYRATGFYSTYYATTGAFLGMFGAIVSLLFNVVGATLYGEHPLKLIQVYLTFPLGDQAIDMQEAPAGIVMVTGCCLYIATGMLLGVPVQLALARFAPTGGLGARLAVASVVALGIWVVNFYLVLSWLQPWLIGGAKNIADPNVLPPWVAILTHLVFAWTMAAATRWAYRPYRLQTEQS